MPGIKCICNNIIRYGEIPNPNEMLMISDIDFDKHYENINTEELYKEMKSILICNVCGRLWVYWDGFQSDPKSYLPEE